jgi:TonB family protein
LNTELVAISQAEPRLSPSVLRDLTEGVVKVSFTVNPDGSTADARIVSSTARSLNNPVLAAVREWRYQRIDVPQRTEVELVYKFD